MSAIVSADASQVQVDEDDDIPTFQIAIQNIVVTVNLGCAVELEKIAQTARNAEYNPRRFAAVIMRIREPRTTALIFKSGKMIVTGAKNESDSKQASKIYAQIVQKVGFNVVLKDYKIQNMTATCDVGFPIRLEGVLFTHAANATYEPEIFPGLVYRMTEPKVTILVFVSGKIVVTGAKCEDTLSTAFTNIFPSLLEFRKKPILGKR